ncbi:MAG: hypothetical protein Q9210_000736 [Variospora velana]
MRHSSSATPPLKVIGARRRKVIPTAAEPQIPPGTKQINAGPLLETPKPGIDPDAPFTVSKAIGITAATLQATVPALISWGATVGLIFGGCCSNVGNLITFVQFFVTALVTWPERFSATRPPFFLKPRAIPLARWLPNILLFFTVNLLNNYAFGYNISVPVHIILRSGGSVTTMGKSTAGPSQIDPSFFSGLLILALAQILSALMGLYTQITYSTYGSHWHENLFYSHFLSLPLFLPLLPSLRSQFQNFISSPPIQFSPAYLQTFLATSKISPPDPQHRSLHPIFSFLPLPTLSIPKDILYLTLNALTQYLCIRGVNLLSARTTALGVTIVLNIRKLASLLLSIWLFGNQLPPGVLLGATVVFGSAGLWAWEGQRIGARGK